MEIGETYRTVDFDHKKSATEDYMRERDIITKIVDINNDKEKLPIMHLINCDFSPETRYAEIEFKQIQEYRTVEMFAKRPIYSEWKTNEKVIKRTIKLTNAVLENLENNHDSLIAIFARQIISLIGIPELEPSWYKRICYLDEYYNKIIALTNECNDEKEFETIRRKLYNEMAKKMRTIRPLV